jgi:hypothetical protein
MSSYNSFWDSPIEDVTDDLQAIEIDHHSGPRVIPIVEGQTLKQTVYDYIRSTHHFLTDENHTVDLDSLPTGDWRDWGVSIIRNEKSPQPYFNWNVPVRPGDVWTTEYFRIVSPHVFDRDVENVLSYIPQYIENARNNRNTIRGRKAYDKYMGFIASMESKARWYTRRKQDLLDGERFDHWAFRAKYEPEYWARHTEYA